ncbi:MAG: CHASE sensor domain-containing protein [Dissulfurispiraceae bacterium]|jgi:methyl-accepting chemotaxis protein
MRTTSIKHKLSLINIISIGFIIILIGLSVFIEEFVRLRTELLTDTTSQAVIIAKNSVSALLFGDRNRSDETLESLQNISDIEEAAIYTKDGRILGRHVRGDIKNASYPVDPGKEGYTFEKDHLAVCHNVVLDNETIGKVYVCAGTARIKHNLLKLLFFIVTVSGLASGAAFLLLGKLQKTIVDPLFHLSNVMNKVTEEKDYSVRTSVHSTDELGMVAGGLNKMLEQIEKWNMELEDKVAARTTTLRQTNELLTEEIAERKRMETERDMLIVELQEALAEVKQLSGLLPICSSCKKIRDDKGYWTQIESYISEHSEALFTHAICPECGKKLYPEYYDDIWGKEDK